MPNEPLITWPDPLIELLGFVAFFLAAGAVGFRTAVLRAPFASSEPSERDFARGAARRAAWLGLIGTLVTVGLVYQSLAERAAERHLTLPALLGSQPSNAVQVALLAVASIGFLLAAIGPAFGWALATLGIVLLPLRAAFLGQFNRTVNPLHELAGGLWIGTLFLMVVLGIAPALRSALSPERRGAVVAGMVNGFSPLALGSVALLALMGVTTAWTHLKRLDAIWTTPYGWTLCVKLLVVAGVLALGAFNWKKQKPKLGTEAGAIALRGSATAELLVAAVVLLITSILVSLPSPR